MERIIHPVTGESGFFCSNRQKILIEAIVQNFNQDYLPHSDVRGNDLD